MLARQTCRTFSVFSDNSHLHIPCVCLYVCITHCAYSSFPQGWSNKERQRARQMQHLMVSIHLLHSPSAFTW